MTNKELRNIREGGSEVTADDEWFDDLLRQYEHVVDTDLIYMARPLFEGVPAQRFAAERLLRLTLVGRLDPDDAQVRLAGLLRSQGMRPGTIPRHDDAEFDKAWDEHSTPVRRNEGAHYHLGTSKEAERNVLADGYPSGAGREVSQPRRGHFSD